MRMPLLRRVKLPYALVRGQPSSRLGPTSFRMMTSRQRNPPPGRAFDITTTNQVARETRGGGRRKDDAAGWHLSGAFTRFDRRFDVFEVSKAGDLRRTSVTLAEVLRDFGVHARDVLSLGLQDERYNPPPAVLPREGVVVIALGPLKALVHTEACLLFEAGKTDVSHVAPLLAELMQANAETPPSDESKQTGMSGEMNATDTEQAGGASGTDRSGDDTGSNSSSDSSSSSGRRGVRDPSVPLATPAKTPSLKAEKDLLDERELGDHEGTTTLAPGLALDDNGARRVSSASGVPGEEGTGGAGASGNSWTESADAVVSKVGGYFGGFALGGRGGNGKGDGDGEEAGGGHRGDEEAREHQMKVMFREQEPMPFELAMLEAMLQEVCGSYHRRAHVVRRLMEQGLKPSATASLLTPNRIDYYRVVPLKLALKRLELKLSQTRTCLEELMHSDEDMLALLLTEAKELGRGQMLDPNRHSVVELLLENYHRQLVVVGHDVAAMKQEMESMQELAAISLDVSRNSMIGVDIRLAMLNLGVASSACVFGAMGMNVVNGLESSHFAFYGLLGGSAAASGAALVGVMRHLRSVALAGDSQQGELVALNTICDHVDDIEGVLRTELETGPSLGARDGKKAAGGGSHVDMIGRDAMARKLSRARGKEVSEDELDLIFAVFDTTGDGSIDTEEYGKLVPDPAGSLRPNRGAPGSGGVGGGGVAGASLSKKR